MSEKEIEFRKIQLENLKVDKIFYEGEAQRLEKELKSEKTFKNDKRYVNYMATYTNLKNNIIRSMESQIFQIEEEITRAEENLKSINEENKKDRKEE